MGEFFTELFSFFFSEWLCHLQEKHKLLYIVIMGCIIFLFAGIAVGFYRNGSPVKGAVLLIFALLMLVLLLYALRHNNKPARRSWNSWFDKRR